VAPRKGATREERRGGKMSERKTNQSEQDVNESRKTI